MDRFCPTCLPKAARPFASRLDVRPTRPANRDEQAILAFGGDARQAGFHDLSRVVLKERGGIHATHEHAAVEPVAIAHHPANSIGVFVHRLRQAGAHQADKVGFDLKVDVIGVEVVFRMT